MSCLKNLVYHFFCVFAKLEFSALKLVIKIAIDAQFVALNAHHRTTSSRAH